LPGISRPAERLNWGVPLPFDPDDVCYIWFEAWTTDLYKTLLLLYDSHILGPLPGTVPGDGRIATHGEVETLLAGS
jgi:hypothetical protein